MPESEQALGKLRQIDTPVAPDVSTIGFHIFIGIALRVQIVAQLLVVAIEKVFFSDAYPIEGRLFLEQRLQLFLHLGSHSLVAVTQSVETASIE